MKDLERLNIQLFAEDPNPNNEEGGKDPTVDELLRSLEDLQKNMVPKEEYEKLKESNTKLINQVTKERIFLQPEDKPKEPTKADIVARCEERTKELGKGDSMQQVKLLTENYRDMQILGMDVSNVDENIVNGLESLLKEAKGDADVFKALMESRIRISR